MQFGLQYFKVGSFNISSFNLATNVPKIHSFQFLLFHISVLPYGEKKISDWPFLRNSIYFCLQHNDGRKIGRFFSSISFRLTEYRAKNNKLRIKIFIYLKHERISFQLIKILKYRIHYLQKFISFKSAWSVSLKVIDKIVQ